MNFVIVSLLLLCVFELLALQRMEARDSVCNLPRVGGFLERIFADIQPSKSSRSGGGILSLRHVSVSRRSNASSRY